MTSKPSLALTHPEVAAQAFGWDASTLTAGSNKKRNWQCPNGHTWEATIAKRALQGRGCPYCAGVLVLAGFNDLQTLHPEIAVQADGWDPSTITARSGKRKAWKCGLGHSWESKVASRVDGHGCHVCAGKAIQVGENDLATTRPDIARQAYEWDPTTLTSGSRKNRKWQCDHGHIWSATVASRTGMNSGCPFCAGRVPIIGQTDLATTHPQIAQQALGWDPTTVTAGSNKRVEWQCDAAHTWNVMVTSRTKQNSGCPFCAGTKVLVGFNDLATTHPELASEAFGWDPATLTSGSGKSVQWKCVHGHVSKSMVYNRANGRGCPVCSNRTVLVGSNDLATTHPELAAQAHEWDPTTLNAGSNKKQGWRCDLGHVWSAQIHSRAIQGTGCPYCANQAVLVGFNDLATTHPELAAQAHEWDPTTISSGSGAIRAWVCTLGHSWNVRVVQRAVHDTGCPFCSGHRVLAGFNDLATTHPELAAQAHGWDPTTLNAGSNKKQGWRCDLGHVWLAQVNSRSGPGANCPYCANVLVLPGYNDLATTRPDLAREAFGWDPTSLMAGSGKKVRWQCENGHIWRTTPSNRSVGTGCPSCAPSGYDPNEPGWVYLIRNEVLDLLQIGISNKIDNRLSAHGRRGWTPIDVIGPIDGHSAREIEQAFLHYLDAASVSMANTFSELFDGYSEAWREEDLRVTSLAEVRDLIRKQDDGSTA